MRCCGGRGVGRVGHLCEPRGRRAARQRRWSAGGSHRTVPLGAAREPGLARGRAGGGGAGGGGGGARARAGGPGPGHQPVAGAAGRRGRPGRARGAGGRPRDRRQRAPRARADEGAAGARPRARARACPARLLRARRVALPLGGAVSPIFGVRSLLCLRLCSIAVRHESASPVLPIRCHTHAQIFFPEVILSPATRCCAQASDPKQNRWLSAPGGRDGGALDGDQPRDAQQLP